MSQINLKLNNFVQSVISFLLVEEKGKLGEQVELGKEKGLKPFYLKPKSNEMVSLTDLNKVEEGVVLFVKEEDLAKLNISNLASVSISATKEHIEEMIEKMKEKTSNKENQSKTVGEETINIVSQKEIKLSILDSLSKSLQSLADSIVNSFSSVFNGKSVGDYSKNVYNKIPEQQTDYEAIKGYFKQTENHINQSIKSVENHFNNTMKDLNKFKANKNVFTVNEKDILNSEDKIMVKIIVLIKEGQKVDITNNLSNITFEKIKTEKETNIKNLSFNITNLNEVVLNLSDLGLKIEELKVKNNGMGSVLITHKEDMGYHIDSLIIDNSSLGNIVLKDKNKKQQNFNIQKAIKATNSAMGDVVLQNLEKTLNYDLNNNGLGKIIRK